MGHYASEMACSGCGKIPCRCERIDTTQAMWLVDSSDLQVMQVSQFDQKYKYIRSSNGMVFPGNPFARRMDAMLFETKEEALAHRVNVINSQIKTQQRVVHDANVQLQELIMKKESL